MNNETENQFQCLTASDAKQQVTVNRNFATFPEFTLYSKFTSYLDFMLNPLPASRNQNLNYFLKSCYTINSCNTMKRIFMFLIHAIPWIHVATWTDSSYYSCHNMNRLFISFFHVVQWILIHVKAWRGKAGTTIRRRRTTISKL